MTTEQLVALLKKNPISFGCAALALVLGLVIYYRMDEGPEAMVLLEQKTAEGERLRANVINAAQLPEQLAAITEAREEIEKRLIGGELARNQQYFYKLEAATGVKIVSISQAPVARAKPGAKSTLTGIGFTVSFQGSYLTVLDFIRRLENGAHYCRVNSASFAGTSNNRAGPLAVSLSLELLGRP